MILAAVLAKASMSDEIATSGDCILLFTQENLALVLQGLGTLDFRKVNYKPGRYLIGCSGRIHGVLRLYRVAAIQSKRDWDRMRLCHKSLAKSLPYTPKTCIFRISVVKTFATTIPYEHKHGAVNIAIYRPVT